MTDNKTLAKTLPTVTAVLGGAAARFPAIPLNDGLSVSIIPRPGQALNIVEHRRIYQALVPVTSQSFAADMTPYWEQRSRDGYLERLAEFALVADEVGAIVGWTGFHLLCYDGYTTIYIDSTGTVPEWQSRGVMRTLLRSRIVNWAIPRCATGHSVYLTARSESPVFYRLMRGLLDQDELYPKPQGPVPADIMHCASDLAEWLGQRSILDPSTLTLRGAYDTLNELYGELPRTGDADLDRLFRGQLGPLDAFLLVGRAR